MKKRSRHITIFFLIIILLVPFICHAQSSIQGKVVRVADGDTISVLQNSKQYKIRLYGIDTPEKKQDFGQRAKLFTSNMVFKQLVTVVAYDIDRYGRTVGMVYIGQKCLNEELVRNGLAWVCHACVHESECTEILLDRL